MLLGCPMTILLEISCVFTSPISRAMQAHYFRCLSRVLNSIVIANLAFRMRNNQVKDKCTAGKTEFHHIAAQLETIVPECEHLGFFKPLLVEY